MPFLLFNLGSEMIYILDQRLKAQNIRAEKSQKVLKDVTKTMFNKQFIDELMKPQPIYSNHSSREIFDKLAHSSIMHLSTSSMDKLYDLMTMGLKYQLMMCAQPSEMIQITLNHLDTVISLLTQKDSQDLVEQTRARFIELSEKKLDCFDLLEIRDELFNFFQDKNIKVSLFLGATIQNPNGTFALHQQIKQPIGYVSGKVGTVITQSKTTPIENHPLSFIEDDGTNHYDTSNRSSNLGFNLYKKKNKEELKGIYQARSSPFFEEMERIHSVTFSHKKKVKSDGEKPLPDSPKEDDIGSRYKQETTSPNKRYGASYQLDKSDSSKTKSSSHQLNVLASMIGGASSPQQSPSEKNKKEPIGSFMLNLFPEDNANDDFVTTSKPTTNQDIECVTIQSSNKSTLNTLNSLVGDFDDEPPSTQPNEEEEDLLDLMDQFI